MGHGLDREKAPLHFSSDVSVRSEVFINAFTTIIGRSIPTARGVYYMNKVGKFPDDIQCIRPAPPEGKLYPGAELVRILPVTPEPVIIDEQIVSKLLGEYKSHFPKEVGLDSK